MSSHPYRAIFRDAQAQRYRVVVNPVVPIGEEQQHVQELLRRVLAEERLIGLVAQGAKTNWRAAAWLLERRYPQRWGPVRPQDESEPAPPVLAADDPFAEVDMLAARRRARRDQE
jgi:hypothetical protein